MPKLAKEISETVLRRLLGDRNRVSRTVVSLGNPRGLAAVEFISNLPFSDEKSQK